jgi:hypothetical protein
MIFMGGWGKAAVSFLVKGFTYKFTFKPILGLYLRIFSLTTTDNMSVISYFYYHHLVHFLFYILILF